MGGETYTPQYPNAEQRRWYERFIRSRFGRRALAVVGVFSLGVAGGGGVMWELEHQHGTAQTIRNNPHKEPAPVGSAGKSATPDAKRADVPLEQVKSMSLKQEAQWMQDWRTAKIGIEPETDPDLHNTSNPEKVAAAALMQLMTSWAEAESEYKNNPDPRLAYAVFGNKVNDDFRQQFFTLADRVKQYPTESFWSFMPFICLPYPDANYRPPQLTKNGDGTYNLETRAVTEDKATDPTEDAQGLARGVSGELYILDFKLVPTDGGKHTTALVTEGHDYGLYTATGN